LLQKIVRCLKIWIIARLAYDLSPQKRDLL
jgi:hypothetical protein